MGTLTCIDMETHDSSDHHNMIIPLMVSTITHKPHQTITLKHNTLCMCADRISRGEGPHTVNMDSAQLHITLSHSVQLYFNNRDLES